MSKPRKIWVSPPWSEVGTQPYNQLCAIVRCDNRRYTRGHDHCHPHHHALRNGEFAVDLTRAGESDVQCELFAFHDSDQRCALIHNHLGPHENSIGGRYFNWGTRNQVDLSPLRADSVVRRMMRL